MFLILLDILRLSLQQSSFQSETVSWKASLKNETKGKIGITLFKSAHDFKP